MVAIGFALIHENDYEETLLLEDFKDLINIIIISGCVNCILKFSILLQHPFSLFELWEMERIVWTFMTYNYKFWKGLNTDICYQMKGVWAWEV